MNEHQQLIFGKTIKLFLIDGAVNARITCELSNWTGKAYKIPRTYIKQCIDRPELETTGVYMLFGKSSDTISKNMIYIGEAENIYKRLQQHLSEKDFWNETVVFISKDENLNKAHIKYLENRLHQIAYEANRFDILNSNKPSPSSIAESDKSEMEEFLSNIIMLVNILGYNVFDKIRKTHIKDSANSDNIFTIKASRGAYGKGEPSSEGFVVFKSSKIADPITNSYPKSIKILRDKLLEEKKIAKTNNEFVLTEDYVFSSSSTAAMIVMGRSANGLSEWKTKNGITLRDYENQEIAQSIE
ncbi:MAG: GIY-YIG nuclease family protein [Desulfobacterales bacterium]|nr:GIY-YIG nuclease family protein [Desulfobacterales bacterium]